MFHGGAGAGLQDGLFLPGLSDQASFLGRVEALLSSLKFFEYVIYFNPHSYFKLNYFPLLPQTMGLVCSPLSIFVSIEPYEMRTPSYMD